MLQPPRSSRRLKVTDIGLIKRPKVPGNAFFIAHCRRRRHLSLDSRLDATKSFTPTTVSIPFDLETIKCALIRKPVSD
jgi:hypothetical protein